MDLYYCDDDGCGCCLTWEERTQAMIWANNSEEAKVCYRSNYTAWTGEDEPEEVRAVLYTVPAGFGPAQGVAHVDERPAFLRKCGWAVESEPRCDVCDLAAMDTAEFRVCPECDRCRECGCDDGCPNKE